MPWLMPLTVPDRGQLSDRCAQPTQQSTSENILSACRLAAIEFPPMPALGCTVTTHGNRALDARFFRSHQGHAKEAAANAVQ